MGKSNTISKGNIDFFSTDHLKPQLKKLAIRGTGATVFAQTLNYGMVMVGIIILSRILTPDDFGLVTMVVVISLILANFGGNGFVEAIVQEEKINHSQISTLFWINTGISGALTLLFMASAPVLAFLYKDQRIFNITIIMGISIITTGLATQHLALLQRRIQFYHIAANSIFAVFLSVAVSIVMALLGFGYWSLVAKHVCYPVSITVGAWLLCKWRPGRPNKFVQVKTLVKFALSVYGNFCINYLSKNIDKVLVGRYHGSLQLGQYDRAYQLSSIFHNQLTVPVASVAVATLSRLRNDPEKCLKYYTKILSIIAFITMPLSAIFTLIGQDLLLLLLGNQWTVAGHIFIAFGPAIGPMLLYGTHTWLHYSMGKADRLLKWSIVGTVVTVVFFLIGIPFGVLGVAVAYSASYYVRVIPGLLYAGRPIKLKLSHIISSVWKYFTAALLSGLLCFYIYSSTLIFELFIELNLIIRIIVTSFFCMSLYLIMVIILYQSFSPIMQFLIFLRDMVPEPLKPVKKEMKL
jgi:polysaccharide transporter, PST family